MQTLYIHDCDECHYLGPYGEYEGGEVYDLWIHIREKSDWNELIYRYSDSDSDYGCMTVDIVNLWLRDNDSIIASGVEIYVEVLNRAKKKELM